MKRGSSWTYVLYLGRDASGKKQQKWVGGHRTKKEAEDALVEALERMRTGMWVDPGTTTFGEFLTEWLAAMESNVLDTTYRGYEQMIRNWVVPRIGDVRLVELSPMHLRSLQTELLRSGRVDGAGGLSARSVASCRRTLKKALKDAMRWGLIARNPMEAVDPPRVVDAEMTIWSDVQTRTFLDAVSDHELYAMWVLFLTTGLRRGEIAALRWEDMDLDRATMAVVRNRVSAGRGRAVSVHQPKTRRGRRNVALDTTSVEVLRTHRTAQSAERLRLGPAWLDSGYVFCGIDGAPLHPDTITATFQASIRDLDVPRIRLHDLRHTSATLALKAGVHPKVVSERLGHATVGITLDLYSHVLDGMQAEAAEQIGAVVFAAGTHQAGNATTSRSGEFVRSDTSST
ncbi:MAG TPA: tyrosine-type recombinase/integrase [Microthrixaceae bacterium]|nr:tyrosine-type recombinase/integrase [Microthrixaceae bacterium]